MIYAGCLTADGNSFAVFVSNVDEVTNCAFNSKVTFVVDVSNGVIVTVATKYEHGQVVGADGVTINIFIELVVSIQFAQYVVIGSCLFIFATYFCHLLLNWNPKVIQF